MDYIYENKWQIWRKFTVLIYSSIFDTVSLVIELFSLPSVWSAGSSYYAEWQDNSTVLETQI